MQIFHLPLPRSTEPSCRVTLTFFLRQKARFRASLDDGTEVGFQLQRGKSLRSGDKLASDSGQVVEIISADEEVSTARAHNAGDLARLCYHLGNRHVLLQIGDDWCRYLHDYVLDGMVNRLGSEVVVERLPFEPEPGAYAAGTKQQGHNQHG